ncbi:MAG: 2TM domain-containing protein [Brachymonas sp.]|nr:2TM domain-containing protein [Brachymonas sp.]NJS35357.1 2TM domain-containing protein [Brachymonas sp.]
MQLAHDLSTSPLSTLSPAEIERLARRRAGAKLGWFIHAAVFVCVNALLIVLSMLSGKAWAIFPLAGWGLGLAIHGAAVWLASPGGTLHERLLQNERARLQTRRDPW